PTPRQDKVVQAAVSVASRLHLTRGSRKQLWSHCLRRMPTALDRGDDRRFGVRRIEQDHVAANSKLVGKAAELVDIVLRLHEPYDRNTTGKSKYTRVIATRHNRPAHRDLIDRLPWSVDGGSSLRRIVMSSQQLADGDVVCFSLHSRDRDRKYRHAEPSCRMLNR